MGNSSSHPTSKRDNPPLPKQSSLARSSSRLRPLKHKKRSIVDHPQLLASQSPAVPSLPIPIPNQSGNPPPQRPTPPLSNDSFAGDYVPDLLSYNNREENSHTHRPIQYNSTRSFGGVRRGGVQGGGWVDDAPRPPPAVFKEEIVRSSIPLRIRQAAPHPGSQGGVAPGNELSQENDPEVDGFNEVQNEGFIPTQIIWRDGGKEVLVAGTFNELEWRARERMRFDPITGVHTIILHLPPGTYRLKFIVDDIWRCSDDMPTATDDETGNLVNYVDVEDPSALDLGSGPGAEERQIVDARVMKANRRRTYPSKHQTRTHNSRSPTTTRYHPPLLPPSESSFWGDLEGDIEHEMEGWERGRDGVLEKWTNVVPESLVCAAQQEEAYMAAVQAQREVRRGGAGTRGSLGSLGMGVPSIPPAPRLPRHLDKVILNTKSSHSSSSGSSHSGRSSRSGKHKSRSGLGMTSLLSPESAAPGTSTLVLSPGASSSVGPDMEKTASSLAMEQWAQADDSSVLPVPSHVVLHHLGTSAIKNGVLAVSDTTRYNKKYITTIYYKPT